MTQEQIRDKHQKIRGLIARFKMQPNETYRDELLVAIAEIVADDLKRLLNFSNQT